MGEGQEFRKWREGAGVQQVGEKGQEIRRLGKVYRGFVESFLGDIITLMQRGLQEVGGAVTPL